MTRQRWISFVGIIGVCVGLTARAHAFLGVGDVVFDPSVYGEAVQQIIRLEQQYAQLVQTYLILRSQYEQLVWSAQRVPVDMTARYRAMLTPWQASSATNTYGTTSAWISAINTGQSVPANYGQSVEALQAYSGALANIPADQLPRVKQTYGAVELADGANQSAIDTLGHLRANSITVQNAIQGLEDDSLSSAPEMNTEVAVLNKINAGELIAVRNGQDTNKLLVAVTEGQLIAAKQTRDAQTRAINQHVQFMTQGQAVLTAQAAGTSDAMLAWRMP